MMQYRITQFRIPTAMFLKSPQILKGKNMKSELSKQARVIRIKSQS